MADTRFSVWKMITLKNESVVRKSNLHAGLAIQLSLSPNKEIIHSLTPDSAAVVVALLISHALIAKHKLHHPARKSIL